MNKETEEYIDDVAEILETVGMKAGAEYLAKHDKTRKYIYMNVSNFQDISIRKEKNEL